MTPGLESFSDWMLWLLPRLFLYPGGVWLLGALLILRLALQGRAGIAPGNLAGALAKDNLAALAAAWVALALALMPDRAEALSVPVDPVALAGLVAVSLGTDLVRGDKVRREELLVGVAITLAVLAPLAGGNRLLETEEGTLSGWVALAAVGAGLVALWESAGRDLSGGTRWLAWLGLGAGPLWSLGIPVEGIYWASGVFIFGILGAAAVVRVVPARGKRSLAAIAWLGAALALLSALLFS